MNSVDFKKGFFGFGLGILIFYIGYRAFTKKEDTMPAQPTITTENVGIAVRAYQDALADGANASKLNDLNTELSKQFGVRVKSENGKIIVTDLSGKVIPTA